jgi:ABC-type multidrug transport system ATPase subunit
MNEDSIHEPMPNCITKVRNEWNPNPGLNILTGVNGSGKTRLLDYIYSYINERTIGFPSFGNVSGTTVNLEFKNPFILVPGEGLRPISNPIRIQYVPILWRTYSDQAFQHEIIRNGMPLQNNHLGDHALDLRAHASLSYKIKTIPKINESIEVYKKFIVSKRQLIDQLHKLPCSNQTISEVEKEIKEKNPLIQIQKAFDSFPEHINLKIKIPSVDELESAEPQVQFLSKDTNAVVEPESLSSGEKIIVYLLVSEQMGLFGELDVLLLDELDAHLNPALIKVYVDILYRIVKAGVQVIATTHNPIVANYIDKNDLWWMDKGKVCNQNSDHNEHKRIIVNQLADGLFSAKDIQGIFSLFTDSEKKHDWIFLVEGKHDVITLLTEFIYDLFPEITIPIINCKGANNIHFFTTLPYRENKSQHNDKQKIICIFDFDQQGKIAYKELDNKFRKENGVLISKPFKNKIFPIFVSDIPEQRMEEVLNNDKQRDKLKQLLIDTMK